MTDDRTPNDDDRRPPTSEELIAEARADVYDDDPLEGYVAPARRFDGDDPAVEQAAAGPVYAAPVDDESAVEPMLPPGPVEMYDEPARNGYDTVGQTPALEPGTDPSPQPSRWGGIVRSLLVVALIAGGWWAVRNFLDSGTSVQSLAPGDCFLQFDGDEVASVETVDCSEPHNFEVFANVVLPEGAYPGQDAAAAQGQELCLAQFEAYVGAPYETSVWWLTTLTPSEDTWSDGDRVVNCLLTQPDPTDSSRPATVTGSARGSGE